jgi:hypothetical protein
MKIHIIDNEEMSNTTAKVMRTIHHRNFFGAIFGISLPISINFSPPGTTKFGPASVGPINFIRLHVRVSLVSNFIC